MLSRVSRAAHRKPFVFCFPVFSAFNKRKRRRESDYGSKWMHAFRPRETGNIRKHLRK
ncbi:Uncharacterized protein APZ42_017309 [Daphnia magna]|uniref:Uncharacterized protein n=1 Tax=Daphnia magna TaxID=35525 RepID=A0A0P5ZZ77_9CRUS|nr:Uncharacterized protein APZ42_017309 [Daphnia magna]